MQALERGWGDAVWRKRGLLACRHWLEAQPHLPRLAALARLLTPEITLRQLGAVLAHVERIAARRRVKDLTLLSADTPDGVASPAPMPLTLVADSLRSAFNVGGLFRTADCFGAAAFWLCR